MDSHIRPVVPADAVAIAAIYNHYITETVITFEEEPLAVPDMERRILEVTARFPWFVSVEGGSVTGYCYASPFRPRASYRFTAEATVYLAPGRTRRGVGSRFYEVLLPALKQAGVHAVTAGVTLPNPASAALHEKFGFEKVAHLKEVGFKFGRWLDVGYWEKLL
jgi:phosphinothricin acetyltransferase